MKKTLEQYIKDNYRGKIHEMSRKTGIPDSSLRRRVDAEKLVHVHRIGRGPLTMDSQLCVLDQGCGNPGEEWDAGALRELLREIQDLCALAVLSGHRIGAEGLARMIHQRAGVGDFSAEALTCEASGRFNL